MADNVNKEKIIIDFSTNANKASKDVNDLNASIEQTTEAVHGNSKAIGEEEKAYKSFKTQLREANLELQKQVDLYGETSVQAVKAAKGVAEIKDQMEAAKDLSEAFNPDQKFKALGAATQIAATGMQGVTAGMALFGDQSEDTQKMLLKVQAAMAFSDAISNLSNLGDQFNVFQAVVSSTYQKIVAARQAETAAAVQTTVAQRILNAVAKSNPYVLLASAIAAVSIAAYAWVKASKEAAAATARSRAENDRLTLSLDNLADAQERANKETEFQTNQTLAMARAQGKSSEELRKLALSTGEQDIAQKKLNSRNADALVIEAELAYRRAADDEESQKAAKETLNNAIKYSQEQSKILQDSYKNQRQIIVDNEVQIEQEKTDARLKAEAEREKASEAARLKREEAAKAERERLAQIAKDANEFQRDSFEREIDEKERQRKEQKDSDSAFFDEIEAREEGYATKTKEIDQTIFNNKKLQHEALENLGNAGISAAKDLFAKNKGVQKAAIIAESGLALGKIGINTVEQVSADNTASPLTFGLPWSAVHLATGALGAASIIANTSKALQAVGGGSAPSAPSLPGASGGINAQPQTVFQASSENQIATSISKSNQALPPIKTYVTSSDVTTAQSLDANLVKENSFGGKG